MIHFFDPSNEKMRAKLPDIAKQTDILLGNLEDAIPADRKIAAREGSSESGARSTSANAALDAHQQPRLAVVPGRHLGARRRHRQSLEVIMVPKVEGPWDIHYVDRLLAQLEAKHKLQRPILVHALLETALGVTNVEDICAASPRMQGISFRSRPTSRPRAA
jgi:malyl-CoA/(S)-citramalyl-CoA lyase